MNILVTICARGGSKGIPGKNIKMLNGRPLISYTIEVAKKFCESCENCTIALSTDSEDIIRVATECGLESEYRRPDYLANDTCGKVDAIKDIVTYSEKMNECVYDYILDLDCTSPLRTLDDLTEALDIIEKDRNAINIFSVSEPGRNPYFNQVEEKGNGYFGLVKELSGAVLSRQSAPKVYDLNASFYFYRREFFDLGYKGAVTDRSLVYVMKHLCFDLDHPVDFEFLSFLLENKKMDFML